MGTMTGKIALALLDPKLGSRSRQMSLSTKPKAEDPQKLIKKAMANCPNPIKITWKNVFYEVDMATTP